MQFTSQLNSAPEPSPYSLYFPYDEQENRYRSSFYEEGMTYGQIPKQEIKSFVSGLNLNNAKNFDDFKSLPQDFKNTLYTSLGSLIIGCVLIFHSRYSSGSRFVSLLGLGFLVGGFYGAFKAVANLFQSQEETSQKTRHQVADYIHEHEGGFREKGLMWKVPEDNFEWIELTIAPNGKYKSMFSDKDTMITLNDTRRFDSVMDNAPNLSKQFLD